MKCLIKCSLDYDNFVESNLPAVLMIEQVLVSFSTTHMRTSGEIARECANFSHSLIIQPYSNHKYNNNGDELTKGEEKRAIHKVICRARIVVLPYVLVNEIGHVLVPPMGSGVL